MNMDMAPQPVLLVIPCYQESRRLPAFLKDLCTTLASCPGVSILVVDDGSGPEEEQRMRVLLDALRAEFPVLREPLFLSDNLGKGGAIYRGWQAGEKTEWLAFVDADGSCSAKEVLRLIQLARHSPENIGALFASRIKILGRSVQRKLHRHLIGRVYATVVSESLNIPVYDSQCGLKLVRRRAFEHIEPLLKLHRFAFDVELLCALLDSGWAVHETPIDWHETPGSKLRLFHDSLEMFRDVLSVKKRRSSEEWRKLGQGGQG